MRVIARGDDVGGQGPGSRLTVIKRKILSAFIIAVVFLAGVALNYYSPTYYSGPSSIFGLIGACIYIAAIGAFLLVFGEDCLPFARKANLAIISSKRERDFAKLLLDILQYLIMVGILAYFSKTTGSKTLGWATTIGLFALSFYIFSFFMAPYVAIVRPNKW